MLTPLNCKKGSITLKKTHPEEKINLAKINNLRNFLKHKASRSTDTKRLRWQIICALIQTMKASSQVQGALAMDDAADGADEPLIQPKQTFGESYCFNVICPGLPLARPLQIKELQALIVDSLQGDLNKSRQQNLEVLWGGPKMKAIQHLTGVGSIGLFALGAGVCLLAFAGVSALSGGIALIAIGVVILGSFAAGLLIKSQLNPLCLDDPLTRRTTRHPNLLERKYGETSAVIENLISPPAR